MKILLFGKTGQVGTQFVRQASHLGVVQTAARADCDLTDPAEVREYVLRSAPGCVVNAAAYTAVDKAESESAACFAVNAAAPGAMAEGARELGIPLVHYSTDYVFNGEKTGAYAEDDPTGPLSVYGRSKLEGEQLIAAAAGKFIILRTSWVYGAEGQNFLRTMLRLGAERPELRIVSDQLGAPTSSRAIAMATVRILEAAASPSGVYHMTAGGSTSWFGFAEKIFELAALEKKPKLVPIATSDYPTAAQRPKNSVLSNEKFGATFGFRLTGWEEQLKDEIGASPVSN
jgi:dTDP-4-dehydrorhamnose reductase